MKKLLIISILLAPLSLLAAPSGSGEYDIVPRTINFLIFAVILFYLLAKPVKNMYKTRIEKIASRLEDIQKRVLESKNKKLELIKKLEDAKKEAVSAKELAKKEAEILANKIRADLKNDLALLEKHFAEQCDYEERKMQREVIGEVLANAFDSVKLSQNELVELMIKKVS